MYQDKRRKSEAAKRKTAVERNNRRKRNIRKRKWQSANQAAAHAGFPMNTAITASWSQLGIDDAHGAELALWDGLRKLAKDNGFAWLAMRAPEKGGRGGRHMHLFCHAPDDTARLAIIGLIAEKTGAAWAWLDLNGRRLKDCGSGKPIHGIMAKSRGGEWMVQRNLPDLGGVDILTAYLAKGDGKSRVDGQHRMSQALEALAKQAAT
jgi:hypothetical protein